MEKEKENGVIEVTEDTTEELEELEEILEVEIKDFKRFHNKADLVRMSLALGEEVARLNRFGFDGTARVFVESVTNEELGRVFYRIGVAAGTEQDPELLFGVETDGIRAAVFAAMRWARITADDLKLKTKGAVTN